MSAGLKRVWDAVWGRGEFSVTVPSMDGALRPNTRLDDAAVLLDAAGVDDIVVAGGRLHFTQGPNLLALDKRDDAPRLVKTYSAPISALAATGDKLAVGLDSGGVLVASVAGNDNEVSVELPEKSSSPSALSFAADGSLYVSVGSARNRMSEWKRDLMMLGSSGSVWRFAGSQGRAEEVGRNLAFPAGVAVDASGAVVVSEAWRHRLVRKRSNGTWEPVLSDIPGYPGRLVPAASGRGYWLSVFAPRSQMVEFVLREKVYRERMIAEVPEDFWMAPSLRAGRSFKEPLQGGGVKHLGIHKPWGPTRSYGLLVRLDENFHPVESFHSRSDGKRHGVTGAADWNGETIVVSRGDGVLVSLPAKAGQA